MSTQRILVSDTHESEFVRLARTGQRTLFRKQILPMNGSFVHPTDPSLKITVDKPFADSLVKNFRAGYCDTVQFPMVNEKNQHVEDPERNLGQVVDLSYDETGVYATIDVRKHTEDIGSTILGASAMMHLNYEDTVSGKKVGPTLLHVAATNRPYLTKLAPFEQIALSHVDADTDNEVVLLTPSDESEKTMTLSEIKQALKDEHGIDLDALEARANGTGELVTALSNVLKAANTDEFVCLSADNTTPTLNDVSDGVVALARDSISLREKNVELSAKVEEFEKEVAEADVEAAVKAGKILPAQREAMLELRLSNEDMYKRLLPEQAIVSLTEDGVTTHEATPNAELDEADAEVVKSYVEKMKNIG